MHYLFCKKYSIFVTQLSLEKVKINVNINIYRDIHTRYLS